MTFHRKLLELADPSINLDSLSPDELRREAEEVALFAVTQLQPESRLDCDMARQLTRKQQMQYEAQVAIAQEDGKWTQEDSSNGAYYNPPEGNPLVEQGIACASCVHYQGSGQCEIVQGEVSPLGFCRLWIIPQAELPGRDSARFDGEVLEWNGLSIGITHRPGESRFVWGVPMRASYGHFRGTWGKAEDGKSVDVYLSKEFDRTKNYTVYRASQKNPETGTLEEWKYGIGYAAPDQFASDLIYHSGMSRFGHVEAVPDEQVSAYRTGSKLDSIVHLDNCGCKACAERREKKEQKKKAIAPDEEVSEREDASAKERGISGKPPRPGLKKKRIINREGEPQTVWVKSREERAKQLRRSQLDKTPGVRPERIAGLQVLLEKEGLPEDRRDEILSGVASAYGAIALVHSPRVIPDLPFGIYEFEEGTAWAGYQPGMRQSTGELVPIRYVLDRKSCKDREAYGKGLAWAMVHEIGHAIDHSIGKTQYASNLDHPDVKPIMDAIANSEAGLILEELQQKKQAYATFNGKGSYYPVNKDHVAYLITPTEQFARAYTQWVGQRSGSPLIQEAMQHYLDNSQIYPYQWRDDDFKQIAEAFDELAARRWKKK